MESDKNNIARLKEEADISTVVDYLGIEVHKKGSAYFILCPSPQHDDTRPTNCYFKEGWNNVYCRACGKSTNAVDLIMYTKGCSYGEAADILWELEGKPSWYYVRRRRRKKKEFSLSKQEAQLIGVHLPGTVLCPSNLSPVKPDRPMRSYPGYIGDGYLTCRVEHCNWHDFATEKQLRAIAKNKAREKRESLRHAGIIAHRLGNPVLEQVFSDMCGECDSILSR
ncbi:CHC2 zinc finger domain-containing protein [Ruminococcus sp. CLA-AA-H200]|uniref:CHC2 zinc finger domain-containing protein n=1 Tax=Ruminococcus turbiniformis TaxID=2881258 RepID=A0ABS8FYC5_9FIRM|nr:CHC2 zinc finger domain-containing protein [Ruminococcus turbiniformis]MCC2254599.1 CHC2 zinc finger domain-containing protein [Ruminococcus turbiniformis]